MSFPFEEIEAFSSSDSDVDDTYPSPDSEYIEETTDEENEALTGVLFSFVQFSPHFHIVVFITLLFWTYPLINCLYADEGDLCIVSEGPREDYDRVLSSPLLPKDSTGTVASQPQGIKQVLFTYTSLWFHL